jgi:transposase
MEVRMGKAISEDLRSRVLKMYRGGKTATETASHYGVCARSVYRWDKQEKETGTLVSGRVRSGRKSKIVIDKRFEEFAKATAHKTLQAMADHWNSQAEEHVSQMAMCRAVKKLGYTRKKDVSLQRGLPKKASAVPEEAGESARTSACMGR